MDISKVTTIFLGALCSITFSGCNAPSNGPTQPGDEAHNNQRVVETMYEALTRGDFDRAFEVMADDVRWIYYGDVEQIPFSGQYVGHEGVKEFFDEYSKVAELLSMELQNLHPCGDKVFVTGVENSRTKATGRTYAVPWVHVIRIADGKITQYEEYIDSAVVAAAFE